MRNTIAKIERSYGGGDFVIIGGDVTVLSIFAAAACGVDLREHAAFELRPGEFWDLDEVVHDYKAGRFMGMIQRSAPTEEVEEGRAALRDLGPRIFADSAAGSWVLGPGIRR